LRRGQRCRVRLHPTLVRHLRCAAPRAAARGNAVFHGLLLPAIGFVLAASAGIAIRQRSAREDKRNRDLRFD